VNTHIASILRKLGLRGRAQVVVAAYESGLVARDRPLKDRGRGSHVEVEATTPVSRSLLARDVIVGEVTRLVSRARRDERSDRYEPRKRQSWHY
jgi:hypothetical protein